LPKDVQNSDQAQLSTDETRVTGQVLSGLCRGAEEQVVAEPLVAAGECSQFGRQGEGEQEVGDGQEQVALRLQPFLRVTVLTLGAVAVAAGMVQVARLAAVGALVDLSAQGGCATLLDGPHCFVVAGQHVRAEAGALGRAIAPEDLGEFYHARRLTTCSMIWAACSFASTVRWV
jgi:hypothetical protein